MTDEQIEKAGFTKWGPEACKIAGCKEVWSRPTDELGKITILTSRDKVVNTIVAELYPTQLDRIEQMLICLTSTPDLPGTLGGSRRPR